MRNKGRNLKQLETNNRDMTRRIKSSKKGNRDGKKSQNGKKAKNDIENPMVKAKMFCTEASSYEKGGNYNRALYCYNLALELNPDDKNGLIARSKCYLSIGKPELALKDAETALLTDKTLVRAIYQKAEALYHLGDFEHSLMYYHRGHRLRPELETFRLGIQKAQEAIENTIGVTSKSKVFLKEKKISSEVSSAKTESNKNEYKSTDGDGKENKFNKTKNDRKSLVKTSRKFRGDLDIDRSYLESLISHPDLAGLNQEDAVDLIKVKAEEGISFLKSRQKFWNQRKPNITTVKLIK